MSTPIPDLSVERQAFANGAQRVAGIDEVGRGAWAGPVSVGVVMVESTVGPQPEKVRERNLCLRLLSGPSTPPWGMRRPLNVTS